MHDGAWARKLWVVSIPVVLTGCSADATLFPDREAEVDDDPATVPVSFLLVEDVFAHVTQTCVTLSDGRVRCLGLGYFDDPPPMPSGPVRWPRALASGAGRTCIVDESGALACAGRFPIGDGSFDEGAWGGPLRAVPFETPVQTVVTNFGNDLAELNTGNNSCVLLVTGDVHCWGDDGNGATGAWGTRVVPELVALPPAIDIATFHAHTCAVLASGEVACWGAGYMRGLGFEAEDGPEVTLVPGISNAVAIASSGSATCVVLEDGMIRCWGADLPEPVVVEGVGDAVEITAGNRHFCARTRDGGVRCWGDNGAGQYGRGVRGKAASGQLVVGLPGPVDALAAGWTHTCAAVSGELYCWGSIGRQGGLLYLSAERLEVSGWSL